MTNFNRCTPDAWVVGARVLPVDPTDFDWPDRSPVVGCGHLVCLSCNAEVKSQVGFYLALDWDNRELVPRRAIQMQTTEDWSAIEGIQIRPDCRLYACRCFYHSEFTVSHTFDPENVDMSGRATRNLPWTCAGHPPLELPVQFGDRSFTDAAALSVAIVEAANDPARAELVRGLYYRTHRGSLEGLVPEALASAAIGPSPLSPALKALFERQTSLAPLRAFTEELVRYQVGLAQPDSTRRTQIVDVLVKVVWQRPAGIVESGTIEMLRDEAIKGVVTPSQLEMFEVFDGDWLVTHVEELAGKNPALSGGILARAGRAMLFVNPDQDAVLKTVSALAHKTGIAAETLSAQAEAALGVTVLDSKQVLEAIRGVAAI